MRRADATPPPAPHTPQALTRGLLRFGDRVVVSQCPRQTACATMAEAGFVKIVDVSEHLFAPASPTIAQAQIGSVDDMHNLVALD